MYKSFSFTCLVEIVNQLYVGHNDSRTSLLTDCCKTIGNPLFHFLKAENTMNWNWTSRGHGKSSVLQALKRFLL